MPADNESIAEKDSAQKLQANFLPDFCQIRALLIIVIIAELLAFVLALAPMGSDHQRWSDLGLISLFVQWIALSSTALLCLCRPWFTNHNVTAITLVSLFVIVGITAVVSLATYHWILSSGLGGISSHTSGLSFVLRNTAIALIISIIALRYFYVQHQSRLSIQAEARSRLNALQARIRPHFLFNSMNTIASLTRSKPELAETVVEDLADLFRNNLNSGDNARRLDAEIDLAKRYLNIEQLRLGSRLETSWQIDELPSDAAVPALLLQPLVENAVYHGIEPRTQGGCISISGTFENNQIRLIIRNPLPDIKNEKNKGSGIALENTKQRLAGWYEGEAKLHIENEADQFSVTLVFPYQDINQT